MDIDRGMDVEKGIEIQDGDQLKNYNQDENATLSVSPQETSCCRKTGDSIKIITRFLFGALWGVFGRKGIMALCKYKNLSVLLVVWANFDTVMIVAMTMMLTKLREKVMKLDSSNAKVLIPVGSGIVMGFLIACLPSITIILDNANEANHPFFKRIYSSSVPGYGIMEFIGSEISYLGFINFSCSLIMYLVKPIERKIYNQSIVMKIFSIFAMVAVIAVVNVLSSVTYSQWYLANTMSPLQMFFGL